MNELTQAAKDVLAERRRQIEGEGWTPEHDDEHKDGQLALAAACYALNAAGSGCEVARNWPWDGSWWKPTDQRRDLVKAAALNVKGVRIDRKPLEAWTPLAQQAIDAERERRGER